MTRPTSVQQEQSRPVVPEILQGLVNGGSVQELLQNTNEEELQGGTAAQQAPSLTDDIKF